MSKLSFYMIFLPVSDMKKCVYALADSLALQKVYRLASLAIVSNKHVNTCHSCKLHQHLLFDLDCELQDI